MSYINKQFDIKNFYLKQLNEVRNHGFKIIFSKLKTLVKLIAVAIPSLIIVLFIRVISPLILIKLAALDMGRIGDITLIWYVKLKKIGELQSRKIIHLFYFHNSTNHINAQWLKMWRRHVNILPSFIFKYVCIINNFFPGYEKYELPPIHTFHRQLIVRNDPKLEVRQQRYMRSLKKNSLNNIIKIKEPLIYFKDEEIKIGYNYLKKIGVHENNFICFNARDRAFLNKYNRDRDWSYHDFRNSDIYNYLPAMEKMVKKNFFCLRTGLAVENKLICSNQKIIDYANSEDQSDLLDVFLGSKCRFYLLSGSGISQIPEVFNRPIVYVNHCNINEILSFAHNSLYIPKKYYSIKKQRLLTFKEFIDLEINNDLSKSKTFQELGIKMIDNTPEEITDVVMEMDSRLNGTWKDNKEEEDLQNKFWSLFKHKLSLYEHGFIKSPTFRIGSDFLKKNQSLL